MNDIGFIIYFSGIALVTGYCLGLMVAMTIQDKMFRSQIWDFWKVPLGALLIGALLGGGLIELLERHDLQQHQYDEKFDHQPIPTHYTVVPGDGVGIPK